MKKDFWNVYSLVVMLFMSGMTYAQEWLPILQNSSTNCYSTEIIESSADAYRVRIKINGLYDYTIENENGKFHRLSLGSLTRTKEIGVPEIPQISQLIAIPSESAITVHLEEEMWTNINIGKIYPVQSFQIGSADVCSFSLNDSVYSSSFCPEIIKVGHKKEWRDIDMVGINICPFKYYPQDSLLSVMGDFVLHVDFTRNNEQESRTHHLREVPDELSIFDNKIFKAEREESNYRSGENYHYLIVVADTVIKNSSKMEEFRRWKSLMGLKTKVVSIGQNVNHQDSIYNYIQAERENGLKYVLLVGNINNLTSKEIISRENPSDIFYSDYWYGCEGNDTVASLPIGRFSVNTLTEFANMVDKTIRYESGKNITRDILLMAHFENNPIDPDNFQNCMNSVMNYSYTQPAYFVTAYGSSSTVTNSYVRNQINSGAHIINYRGHGQENAWGHYYDCILKWNVSGEAFSGSQVDSMSSNTNAIFFSVACNTGDISTGNCMLDSFTRASNGAAAFVGCSRASEHTFNTFYNIELYKQLFDQGTCRLGDLNVSTQVRLIAFSGYSTGYKETASSYICGGDPALKIWTTTPQQLTNIDVSSQNQNIHVSTNLRDGFMVYVSSLGGELLDSICVSSSTQVTFSKPADQFYFSIIAPGYAPYVVYCDSQTGLLQDVDVNNNRFYDNTPFKMGEDVNPLLNTGDVVLKSGNKLSIQLGSGGVKLDNGFKCEQGAALQIK